MVGKFFKKITVDLREYFEGDTKEAKVSFRELTKAEKQIIIEAKNEPEQAAKLMMDLVPKLMIGHTFGSVSNEEVYLAISESDAVVTYILQEIVSGFFTFQMKK